MRLTREADAASSNVHVVPNHILKSRLKWAENVIGTGRFLPADYGNFSKEEDHAGIIHQKDSRGSPARIERLEIFKINMPGVLRSDSDVD